MDGVHLSAVPSPVGDRYAASTRDEGEQPMGEVDDHEIRLQIPAISRYLRLARLTAAGMAADRGFPVEAIEDLRVAVDELSAAVIDGADPTEELSLTFREIEHGLVIEGSCKGGADTAPVLHAVARELLEILADEYTLGATDGHHHFRLVKLAAP